MRNLLRGLLVGVFALVLAACSGGVVLEPTEGPVLEARQIARAAAIEESTVTFSPGNPSEIALEASQRFFGSAQVVILASSEERDAITRAASIAVTLGVPLLLTAAPGKNLAGQDSTDPTADPTGATPSPGSLNTELLRLGTRAVMTVGAVSLHQLDTTSLVVTPVPEDPEQLASLLKIELLTLPQPATDDAVEAIANLDAGQIFEIAGLGAPPAPYGTMPETLPAERNAETIVLTGRTSDYAAGVATARAAGATIFTGTDPASRSAVVDYAAGNFEYPVVGIGAEFEKQAPFARMVKVLRTGAILPSGAQRIFRADGRNLTVVTVDAATVLKEDGIDNADDVTAHARDLAEEVAEAWKVSTVAGVDVDLATTTAADLAYWESQTADADQYLLLRVSAAEASKGLLDAHADLLRRAHVGVRIDVSDSSEYERASVEQALATLTRIAQGERLPQKLFVIDVGSQVDDGAMGEGLASTPEVAIAYSFRDGQRAQWESVQEQIDADSSWGVVATKKKPKDEDAKAAYPSLGDIMGANDVSLLTFR